MFEAYTIANTTYELNDNVVFDSVRYSDCRVRTSNGSNFTIGAPGRYLIAFNGTGSSGTAASDFAVQLYNNGVAIPAVVSEITSTGADEPQSMSFTTIVNVMPSNCYVNNVANLQIRVISEVAGALENANLVIFRLK